MKSRFWHPNSQGPLYVYKATKPLIPVLHNKKQTTFQIVVIHMEVYWNKGQKLSNRCVRSEVTVSWVLYTIMLSKSQQGIGSTHMLATRGLGRACVCRRRDGGLPAPFPFTRHEVHVREYAFDLLKLDKSHVDLVGRKASILPEDSQRHGAECLWNQRPPGLPYLYRLSISPPHCAHGDITRPLFLTSFSRWLPFADFSPSQVFIPGEEGKAGWPWTKTFMQIFTYNVVIQRFHYPFSNITFWGWLRKKEIMIMPTWL